MNIVFLRLYITNETNSAYYNSQEIGLAKALVELHPEHRVDIVMLSGGEPHREQIAPGITLHVLTGRGIGHHGVIKLDILKELGAELVHFLTESLHLLLMSAVTLLTICQDKR